MSTYIQWYTSASQALSRGSAAVAPPGGAVGPKALRPLIAGSRVFCPLQVQGQTPLEAGDGSR